MSVEPMAEFLRCAEEHGEKVISAAEYAGLETGAKILEARRRELYG